MIRLHRMLAVAPAALLVVALTACGSSEPEATAPPAPSAAEPAQPAQPDAPAGPEGGVPALTGDPTDLTVPTQAEAGVGAPPAQVVTEDVVQGEGTPATLADTVAVRYTGTLWTDGSVFDSSWQAGDEPIEFPLGRVVPGFAQGIEGMAPGARRVIVIPPDQGYGDAAQGPIPGGSTLVFVVDLVSIA